MRRVRSGRHGLWSIPGRFTTSKAKRDAAATVFTIVCIQSGRTRSSSKIAIMTVTSGLRAMKKSVISCASLPQRILDLKRDPAHQVREPVQGLRQANAGQEFEPSNFTDHRDYAPFPAACCTNFERGGSILSAKSAVSSAISSAGGAPGSTCDRGSWRLPRARSLRAARSLRNLDHAEKP